MNVVVVGACVPSSQLLGHTGGRFAFLPHWGPAVHEAKQP